jgi:uncharacterized protein YceK
MMSKARYVLLGAFVLVLFSGCKTVTGITYHHFDPNDGSYWMTTLNVKQFGPQSAKFWRCANYADGPACVLAKFIDCPKGADCSVDAASISSQVNLDAGCATIRKSRAPTPGPVTP